MKILQKRSLLILLLLFMGSTGLFAADNTHIDSGATAWMLTSTALVLLMIPGLAMFYGGLVRSKNVLGTIMHSFVAMGIISVLWVILGYSMCFGKNILGGWFGWNPDYFFLKGIDTNILDAGIPEYVFTMFQGKFAIITPALIAGAFAERVNFKAYCFFIAIWSPLHRHSLRELLLKESTLKPIAFLLLSGVSWFIILFVIGFGPPMVSFFTLEPKGP